MKTKICSKCKKLKNITEFYKNKNAEDGLSWNCKKCSNKLTKNWGKKNRKRINKKQQEWKIKNPIKGWCINTRNSHRRTGYQMNITFDELYEIAKMIEICSICGTKLKWKLGQGRKNNTPSLDRINNEKFLNKNNVWIVCSECNATKGSRSLKEFYKYCEMIYANKEIKERMI